MCFSAEADLVAGLVVGAVGVDAVRHVRRPEERALAAIPLVLAVHQLTEVVVWRGLEGHVDAQVWRSAMWLYLLVAFVVLPVLVPLAVQSLEPSAHRRRTQVFVGAGIAVALVLVHGLLRGPVNARIEGYHVAYIVDLSHGGAIVLAYVGVTCGSLLLSSHVHVRWFGAANVLVVSILAWVDRSGLISLWCVWAAVSSTAIAIHLRHMHRAADPPIRVAG